MCGIAGIMGPAGEAVDEALLRRMTRMLTHRGPDEEGYYAKDGVGLGHRRLSIIDLAGGKQPVHNEDKSVWVTFNGEIFNYVELREDLVKRGHSFYTRSDTEVIVHLYEEYGLDFVDKMNGQFAFAVWDERRGRMVLARDRVGIRPLFHARVGGSLLFASEMKSLFCHPGLKAEMDPVGIAQILSFWVNVPPRTVFRGVEELGPGRMLVIERDGRSRTIQYWRPRFPRRGEYEDRPLSHWTERLREILYDATTLQLRSDVPVAAYLSGGIDSSITSALVKKHHINDLVTFSVAFQDGRFDEREYQEQMSAFLKTDHRMIQVGYEDVGRAFSDVVWFAERPMLRTAPAPLLQLSGLVRRSGIKVVLTGEGADEIFGGYNIFREDKVRRFWAREPESRFRPLLLNSLYGYIKRDPQTEAFWRMFFRKGMEDTGNPYYSHAIRWRNTAQIRGYLTDQFGSQMPGEEELIEGLRDYLDPEMEAWHPLCRAQYLEMNLFMSGYLLNSQGDRMMMGNSVEGRFPFLDHRLIEFAATIPPKYKINGLREKYVLKRAYADLIPDAIVNRDKKPYRAPIAQCFAGQDNLAARVIQPEALQRAGYVKAEPFRRLLDKAAKDGTAVGERGEMAIAFVASLQLLHRQFIENFEPQPHGT